MVPVLTWSTPCFKKRKEKKTAASSQWPCATQVLEMPGSLSGGRWKIPSERSHWLLGHGWLLLHLYSAPASREGPQLKKVFTAKGWVSHQRSVKGERELEKTAWRLTPNKTASRGRLETERALHTALEICWTRKWGAYRRQCPLPFFKYFFIHSFIYYAE